MASKVLAGLLYIFIELYLDDVLVYATKDENASNGYVSYSSASVNSTSL
jgi:hypothetical protein